MLVSYSIHTFHLIAESIQIQNYYLALLVIIDSGIQ